MTKILRLFIMLPLVMLLVLMTLAGCSASPKAATTTSSTALPQSSSASSQPSVPAISSVTERGIVTEHSSSDFSLITDIGRLVLKFDKSTVSEKIDLNTQETVTEPLKESSLFLGAQVFVEYDPTSKFALKIVFNESTKVLFTMLTGTVTQISGPNIYMDVVFSGVTRNLLIKYDGEELVVIRSDSSRGNVSELNPGMNVRVFCKSGTNGAAAIEIQ